MSFLARFAFLPVQRWLPERIEPRAIILALHGFNDYANAVDMPASFWAKNGIATYAYDQRGFGGAPNRGYWAGTRTMTADLRDAVQAIRQRHSGTPLFLLGVSMGGAVTMAALAEGPVTGTNGAILIAPAVWGRRHMNALQRGTLWFLSNTVPMMKLTGEGLQIKPSDNIEMLRALSRDRKIIRETRVDAIKGLVDLMDDAFAASCTDTERGPPGRSHHAGTRARGGSARRAGLAPRVHRRPKPAVEHDLDRVLALHVSHVEPGIVWRYSIFLLPTASANSLASSRAVS